jgi:hypothetical protein
MRGIADRALDLIWDREFPEKREIPPAWVSEWVYDCQTPSQRQKMEEWRSAFPSDRPQQIRLLQLITGAYRTQSAPKASHIPKSAYYLLNGIFSFGNFGQHLDGEKVTDGTAVSVVMSCIELAECITTPIPENAQ